MESFGQLFFAFCQEFFGSLFMYLLFFPVGGMLGNTLDGWIFHFLAVIIFDVITFGACVNPAVCLSLFIAGKMSFVGTSVRLLAEILVSLIAFNLLHSVLPDNLIPLAGGPELAYGIDMFHGSLIEGSISFVFALTVLFASVFVVEPELSRPFFAAVIRILIIFGGNYTGANMNPMIGLSWAWYTNRLFSQEYQIVYTISPLLGGISAALIYHLVMIFCSVKKSTITKSEILVSKLEKVANKLPKKEISQKKKVVEKTAKKVPEEVTETRHKSKKRN